MSRRPTVRLTAAQAAIRYLAAQVIESDGAKVSYFAGAWAIFGHGNVAGLGDALYAERDRLPTFRAHNEQAMAHAAIGFAKASRRRRAMICTSSIGPGATNMVTAAALAHVNRLPILFLPGDVYASRRPDPVLQQVESFADATISANDAFRPVSRYFDRIVRPEQLLDALPRAMATLTDPAGCGPVTLAFCQDVQAEAWDYPVDFFEPRTLRIRRPAPDPVEMDELEGLIRAAKSPLLIAGGGVLYARAEAQLGVLATSTGMPVAETQAGKGSLPWDHPCALGGIGVTGTGAANAAAAAADLVIGVGTRLQDFTTGSRTLVSRPGQHIVQINVTASDAHKHGAVPVVGDAGLICEALIERLAGFRIEPEWARDIGDYLACWNSRWDGLVSVPGAGGLPGDAAVIGAVWKATGANTTVVAAAGGLPGELHMLWRPHVPGSYHCEYGYSCMGYEIAGGLGVKMARPDRDVVVMVGDGSYLMLNSEIATSVGMGLPLIIVMLDNRGFGCIDRLQRATGQASFQNLLDSVPMAHPVGIDFVAHARSLGALARKVSHVDDLAAAIDDARTAGRTSVIVIDTDPALSTMAGGHWWDVAIPAVSAQPGVREARADYEAKTGLTGGRSVVP